MQIEKVWSGDSGVLIMEEHQYNKARPFLIPAQFIIQPFFAVNELPVWTPHVAAVLITRSVLLAASGESCCLYTERRTAAASIITRGERGSISASRLVRWNETLPLGFTPD